MDVLLLVAASGGILLIAYFTYGRWLSRRVFRLDPDRPTPAVTEEDGSDYVPTRRSVVFGHHFTSIAGTGPIVGPAIAVMWGWLPAILWVVIGSIFIGAVHDLGSIVVSLRNKGRSIGDVAGDLLGPRVRLIFLSILIVGLWIVLAVFGLVIAAVLRQYPSAIFPVVVQAPVAVLIGVFIHRRGKGIGAASVLALVVMYLSVVYGDRGWLHGFNAALAAQPLWLWTVALLGYAYVASVLPVWVLLQPRDYINALQLIATLALIVLGLVAAAALGGAPDAGGVRAELSIVAPVVEWQPVGAPPLLPVLFITIACGAVSGFHCLVGSGTTSKQIRRETDARAVGYGSMLTEGFLATLVIAACAAGIGLGVVRSASTGGYGISRGDTTLMTWLVNIDPVPVWDEASGRHHPHQLVVASSWSVEGAHIEADTPLSRSASVTLLPPEASIRSFGASSAPDGQPWVHVDFDGNPTTSEHGGPVDHSVVEGTRIFSFANGSLSVTPPLRPVTSPASGRSEVLSSASLRYAGPIAYDAQYTSWQASGGLAQTVGAFVQGAANFLAALGIPIGIGVALIAVMVASFAATTMDTACRLQRYVIQELSRTFLPRIERRCCLVCGYSLEGLGEHGEGSAAVEAVAIVRCPECGKDNPAHLVYHHDHDASWRRAHMLNPFKWSATVHGATLIAVVTAMALAFIPPVGSAWSLGEAGKGGMILWPLFGATNQLLAGFAFIVIGAWLIAMKRPVWFLIVPAVFMLIVPASAMTWQAFIGNESNASWLARRDWLLVVIAGVTLLLEVWLLVETAVRWKRGGVQLFEESGLRCPENDCGPNGDGTCSVGC